MLTPAALREVPMLLKLMFGNRLPATNRYHTSAPVVLPQVLTIPGLDGVYSAKFPDVFEQLVPELKSVDPKHSSAAGGLVMQIENPRLSVLELTVVLPVTYTRT